MARQETHTLTLASTHRDCFDFKQHYEVNGYACEHAHMQSNTDSENSWSCWECHEFWPYLVIKWNVSLKSLWLVFWRKWMSLPGIKTLPFILWTPWLANFVPIQQLLRYFTLKQNCQPPGGAGGSPESVGFILWGPWTSVGGFMARHPTVVENNVTWWPPLHPLDRSRDYSACQGALSIQICCFGELFRFCLSVIIDIDSRGEDWLKVVTAYLQGKKCRDWLLLHCYVGWRNSENEPEKNRLC